MTQSKHTPGPWKVIDEGGTGEYAILSGSLDDVGDLEGDSRWVATTHNDSLEDAHLIAAAPKLLAACRSVVKWLGHDELEMSENACPNFKKALLLCRAAIAKATGAP